MLNLCVFIFILYGVSYSASVILFGNRCAGRKKIRSSILHSTCGHSHTKRKIHTANITQIKLNKCKAKRLGNHPKRFAVC